MNWNGRDFLHSQRIFLQNTMQISMKTILPWNSLQKMQMNHRQKKLKQQNLLNQ